MMEPISETKTPALFKAIQALTTEPETLTTLAARVYGPTKSWTLQLAREESVYKCILRARYRGIPVEVVRSGRHFRYRLAHREFSLSRPSAPRQVN